MARSAIHPGKHFAKQPTVLDMSTAELGQQVRVPPHHITKILKGERAITDRTALRLGHFFGTSLLFWLNLQMLYELRRAGQKIGDSITNTADAHARWLEAGGQAAASGVIQNSFVENFYTSGKTLFCKRVGKVLCHMSRHRGRT